MVAFHVHISHGVSKLGADIPSVNLPPVITCREDAPCFSGCYARKGRFSFQHNKDLLSRNLEIWNESKEDFERDVMIAAFHARFFRWHSSGDIPDADYLDMIVRVAVNLPHTMFLCFTKKFELVNQYIDQHGALPSNLSMVFSAWGNWLPANPHGLPVAYVRLGNAADAAIPQCARECPKYCGECVMSGCSCWDLKHGESVVFNKH